MNFHGGYKQLILGGEEAPYNRCRADRRVEADAGCTAARFQDKIVPG